MLCFNIFFLIFCLSHSDYLFCNDIRNRKFFRLEAQLWHCHVMSRILPFLQLLWALSILQRTMYLGDYHSFQNCIVSCVMTWCLVNDILEPYDSFNLDKKLWSEAIEDVESSVCRMDWVCSDLDTFFSQQEPGLYFKTWR